METSRFACIPEARIREIEASISWICDPEEKQLELNKRLAIESKSQQFLIEQQQRLQQNLSLAQPPQHPAKPKSLESRQFSHSYRKDKRHYERALRQYEDDLRLYRNYYSKKGLFTKAAQTDKKG